MRFTSTAKKIVNVTARQAILEGMPADRGLYLPNEFPQLAPLPATCSIAEGAYHVLSPYLLEEIPASELEQIVAQTFTFPVPLVQIAERRWALELFHGPTFAFKDFGARFLARTTEYFRRNESRELTILVATSGDTGSAVAQGFFGIDGIRTVLLYPSGKVSPLQEQQLTTVGGNCTALEVSGTFDDCQRLVKDAFLDADLKATRELSSANSINIGRLLPQASYYYLAEAQLPDREQGAVFSVPSGNFGNLCAGLLAERMGLPVSSFVAAVNSNDVFLQFLASGEFRPQASLPTLSNAMDVGNPSNVERIRELFANDPARMKRLIFAASFTDQQTLLEMKRAYEANGYMLDPHGAVASLGLEAHTDELQNGVFLETAHPAKFAESVRAAIGIDPPMPEALRSCLSKTKASIKLEPTYEALRSYLTL